MTRHCSTCCCGSHDDAAAQIAEAERLLADLPEEPARLVAARRAVLDLVDVELPALDQARAILARLPRQPPDVAAARRAVLTDATYEPAGAPRRGPGGITTWSP